MTRCPIVWDDTLPVPEDIAIRVGLPAFGRLLHRRETLRARAHTLLVDAGYPQPTLLIQRADRQALLRELDDGRQHERRFVYLTSDLLAADPAHLRRVVAKLGWSDRDLLLQPPRAPSHLGVASLSGASLARVLEAGTDPQAIQAVWREALSEVERLEDEDLQTLTDPATFTRFLSGALDTRAFNAMSDEGAILRKTSADVDKIRREHDWYYLLPAALQRFAVQPFDLQVAPDRASYAMERLRIPDAAIQWVHGEEGLPDRAALDLLDQVFQWLKERPVRRDDPRGAEVTEAYYRHKVQRRLDAFLATPIGRRVDGLLAAGGRAEGLAGLHRRYLPHLDRALRRGSCDLALLHGDLCFSNILFDRRSGLTRLIDPRGAEEEADLYGPATYDLAKLSHSILGGYDFINQGLFDLRVDDDLRLRLRRDAMARPAVAQAFAQRLGALGHDLWAVRTFEASLFLSMLPLHAESARKCLGFALAAAEILDALDGDRDLGA